MEDKNLEKIVEEWGDWAGYNEDFHSQKKGPYDSDLRLEVGSKLNTPLMGQPGDAVDKAIKTGLNKSQDALVNYTDRHFEDMAVRLSKLGVNMLYSQALSMNPRKSGNPEHDKIVGLHLELIYLSSLIEKKKIGEMQEYLINQTEDKYIRDFLAYYIRISPENTVREFQKQLNSKGAKLQGKFMENKDLSKKKVLDYVLYNIKRVRVDEYTETDKDKKKALKKEKESIYLSIAKNLYDAEKAEEKK